MVAKTKENFRAESFSIWLAPQDDFSVREHKLVQCGNCGLFTAKACAAWLVDPLPIVRWNRIFSTFIVHAYSTEFERSTKAVDVRFFVLERRYSIDESYSKTGRSTGYILVQRLVPVQSASTISGCLSFLQQISSELFLGSWWPVQQFEFKSLMKQLRNLMHWCDKKEWWPNGFSVNGTTMYRSNGMVWLFW